MPIHAQSPLPIILVFALAACDAPARLPEGGLSAGVLGGSTPEQYGAPKSRREFQEIVLPQPDPYFGDKATVQVDRASGRICGLMLDGPRETRSYTSADREAQIREVERVAPSVGKAARLGLGDFSYRTERITTDEKGLKSAMLERLGQPSGYTATDDPLWFDPAPNIHSVILWRNSSETEDGLALQVLFDRSCALYLKDDDPKIVAEKAAEAAADAKRQSELDAMKKETARMQSELDSMLCDTFRRNGREEAKEYC